MSPQLPGRGRVGESRRIARAAFVSALAFAVIAASWSVYVLAFGGSWSGPLHSFLAGTVLLAISGASQMFTITWSSTIPPSRTQVATQRWLLIAGAGAVLVGVTFGVSSLIWVGGAAAAGGVVLLGSMIYASVRRSPLRRFDLSARFYLAAFAAATLGIGLGTIMGAEVANSPLANVRSVHAHLSLVGLVGLTIIGAIPTLLPTSAYSRSVSGREAVIAWWAALIGTGAIAVGLWAPELVGAGDHHDRGRRRPDTRRDPQSSMGPRPTQAHLSPDHDRDYLADRLESRRRGQSDDRRADDPLQRMDGRCCPRRCRSGPGRLARLSGARPQRFAFRANRDIMEKWLWLPLITLNAAGLTLGAGFNAASVILSTVWVADFGIRLVRVIRRRSDDDADGASDD
jgi:hypothetical protein